MPKLTIEIRENIIELYKSNMSQRHIANKFGTSKGGVKHLIEELRKQNSLEDLSKCRRSKKYTEKNEKNLIRISNSNPKLTAKAILCDHSDFPKVSLSTVKIILRKYGLYGRIAAQRPKLSISQIQIRLK